MPEVVWVGNSGPTGKSLGQKLGRCVCTVPGRVCWRQWYCGQVLYRGCRVSGVICDGPVSFPRQPLSGNCPYFFPALPGGLPQQDLRRGLWFEPPLTLFSPVVSRPRASQDRGQPSHFGLL